MSRLSFLLLASATATLTASEPDSQPSAEGIEFFETKIRPALDRYCFECHAAGEKIKGGLRLDYRDGALHGGDSGPAVVPGDLDASLLYTAVSWADREYQMPPKRKLPAEVIADFRAWIEMGAPDPRVPEEVVVTSGIDIEKGREFWSFQPPARSAPPTVRDRTWPRSDIDRFVLAKLEAAELAPAADASPATLLRRLCFDLVGLPPRPEEIREFADAWTRDPDAAYRAKVDDLLASQQFGERWGRHWLDVARYAESCGMEINQHFPHAWRYRDYVIDAFNADTPYDRFITEQIAGDLLPIRDEAEWRRNLVATGFLAVGPKSLNQRNPRQFAMDLADEQIDATSQAILGLTISCARCHDHKSDPIPTEDYYKLAGIFQSTKTHFGTVNAVASRRGTKLIELPVPDADPPGGLSPAELARLRERAADTQRRLQDVQEQARRARVSGQPGPANLQRDLVRLRTALSQMQARLNSVNPDGSAKTFAMGVQDQDRPVDAQVLLRGELDKPAQRVERGFLQVLDHPDTPAACPDDSSGRLELARWMTSPRNPLTARVMVNRVWAKLLGAGIVRSPDNFGVSGAPPTHPELLDWLARRFVEHHHWSVKGLIREIVHTRAYRMGSAFDAAAHERDPDNELLWRRSPRRLDAEALRDAMLLASGELDPARPRGSLIAEIGDGTVGRRTGTASLNRAVTYRSVYLPAARDALPESLALFDAADSNTVAGRREETNVPGQSLYLMNNPFVIARATAMADRLRDDCDTVTDCVRRAFLACFGRPPGEAEMAASRDFFRQFRDRQAVEDDMLVLSAFCQGLFAAAEFRYLN